MAESREGAGRGSAGDGDRLIPARYSPFVTRMFERHVRSMFRRNFHAVRFAEETAPVLRGACEDDRPLIVAMNHSSWWDPLVPLVLSEDFLHDRIPLAPMDAEQLEKFGFFRRLGIFGMDPDDPASLEAMAEYVGRHLREVERAVFLITPQGRFADARSPIRLRPGISAIAAEAERAGRRPNVVCLAIEYAFWLEKKPEVFLRAEACEGGHGSTTAWHRALTRAMQRNQEALAALVMAREPGPFSTLLGGPGGVNPVMDLLLRLRGKDPSLRDSRRVGNHEGDASNRIGSTKPSASEDAT